MKPVLCSLLYIFLVFIFPPEQKATCESMVHRTLKPDGRINTLNTSPLSNTVITYSQYNKFCEETGREKSADVAWRSKIRPVIRIDWKDAIAFYQWATRNALLNILTGVKSNC